MNIEIALSSRRMVGPMYESMLKQRKKNTQELNTKLFSYSKNVLAFLDSQTYFFYTSFFQQYWTESYFEFAMNMKHAI